MINPTKKYFMTAYNDLVNFWVNEKIEPDIFLCLFRKEEDEPWEYYGRDLSDVDYISNISPKIILVKEFDSLEEFIKENFVDLL